MNGVAVIDRVTIDCIFSGMAGFPGAGEELYTDRFSMTLGGGACVTPVRLGNMGVPVRYGTFLGQGLLSKTAETLLQKYKVQNLHNFYDGDGEPVIFSSVFSFPSDRSIMTFDSGLGENLPGRQWVAGLGGQDRHETGIDVKPAKAPLPDEPAHRQRRDCADDPFEIVHGRVSLDR